MSIIGKLKRFSQKIFLYYFFFLRNRFSNGSIVSSKGSAIISLTTFRGRIDSVYLTIESLFYQKKAAVKHVVLWLSLEEFPEKIIPKTLERLKKRGLMIEFVDGNLRSYKKLIYSYQRFKGFESIITVDDDVFYPAWWLSKLLERSQECPGVVVCYRGHFLSREAPKKLRPYSFSARAPSRSVVPSFNLLPTGVGGVLYPRGSLNEYVCRTDLFSELCPNADDIWFKVVTLLTNTKGVRVFERNVNFLEVPNSQRISLFSKNLDLNENDEQMARAFEYFDLYEKIEFSDRDLTRRVEG